MVRIKVAMYFSTCTCKRRGGGGGQAFVFDNMLTIFAYIIVVEGGSKSREIWAYVLYG